MDIEALSMEEREGFYSQNSALLEEGGMNHDEIEILFADGELHTILQWVTTFEQADGAIGGLVGITADITDQKLAEQAIRASAAKHRTIFQNSPLGMILFDSDGFIVDCNDPFVELMGSSREQLIGFHTLEDATDPAVREGLAQAINGQQYEYEGDYTSATGGATRSLRIIYNPVNPDQIPTEVIATLEDVSERKRLEADIANQLSFIRTLVDTIPNPIFAIDSDHRYSLINQAYEEAHGVGREEFIGKTVLDLAHFSQEDKELYFSQDKALLETGGMNHDEFNIRYADGQLHTILQWVTSFERSDGSIGGLVGITADITEQKELERLLAIANERMSTELNFARDIQLDMLPLIFPAFPNRTEVTVHAALESAREVGGDFYDFYFLDDDHLCFVIGDVAGKGAPGALMMAVSKTLIKSRAADDDKPASILTHVNDELSQDNKSSMFVTVFLGVINVKTGELVYTNAGHNPPYIRRHDGSLQKVDAFHGPVIGAMPGLPYDQDNDVLHPGDTILLYTDGVTEAFNEEEQLFSEDRLEALLPSESFDSAESIITGTIEEVNRFAGEAEQSDDVTLLAVQYLGLPDAMASQELEITIKNRYEDMGIVEEQFDEFSNENALPDPIRQSMSIVLDEMLNNIISYAYQGEKEKEIEVHFELSGKRLVLTIKDAGVPFNPFARETPDITESVEEREIGGLGIHMVRSLMDEVSYQRQINKNVVTLVKLIED
jgi:sigma-B regulation protein RsbU (phosphoserine phosphatase)